MKRMLGKITGSKYIASKYSMRVGYGLFFLTTFIIFLYSTLPNDSIKDRIKYEVEVNTPLRVDMQSVEILPIFKVNIKGVVFSDADGPLFMIDELSLSPGVFNLLRGRLVFPFRVKMLGGGASGSASLKSNRKTKKQQFEKTALELYGLDIAKTIGLVSEFVSDGRDLPTVEGTLSGVINLEFNPTVSGMFALSSSDLSIRDLKIGFFKLPELSGETLVLKGTLESNSTNIEELRIWGDDIDLRISGRMSLPWKIRSSDRLNFNLRLKTTDPALSSIKSFISTLPDGSVAARITGTWRNPRMVPGTGTRDTKRRGTRR